MKRLESINLTQCRLSVTFRHTERPFLSRALVGPGIIRPDFTWREACMKILLTGHKGQLGAALTQALARHTVAHEVTGVDLPELDITERTAVFT
ncbi:MAG: sugar nucleotide-binding protein, partial [Anaerolineales bacterium]|nr:sugar nucleotide-binding protein [Anaerolineales bacterium]